MDEVFTLVGISFTANGIPDPLGPHLKLILQDRRVERYDGGIGTPSAR
jgi:hypothetical protein